GVEGRLAADRRDADGVAVAADAVDDAAEEVALARVLERAEAQAVERRHRARAHREDVAQDAADARRGALPGLDEGRAVVALDLEDRGEALADRDDARVLARPLEHTGPARRQRAQVSLARLVRAVLRPHHREDPELGEGRGAAEDLEDARVLGVGEPVLACEGEVDARRAARTHRAAPTASTSEPRIACPSRPPIAASAGGPGWGITPSRLPRWLGIPATSPTAPLGFASAVVPPAASQ